MVSKEMWALGANRSVIRDLFEYGLQQAKVVGPENVFDYSLGKGPVLREEGGDGHKLRLWRRCQSPHNGNEARRSAAANKQVFRPDSRSVAVIQVRRNGAPGLYIS